MSVITKDLGIASAYGYAKSKGYTGTEEEFAELMASYADVAQQAEAAAQDAEDAKDAAVSAKNDAVTAKTAAQAAQSAAETASGTATTKASEAAQSAQSAAGSASAAQTSATAASGSASTAQTAAQTATNKASEASSSASAASTAKTGAETARTGAQTAQAAAETAQENAEAAAASVSASAAQIEQNTADIGAIKNDLSEFPNGNYPQMGAGYANQLVSGLKKADQTPYNFRKVPYDATLEEVEKAVGVTVVNNQNCDFGSFINTDTDARTPLQLMIQAGTPYVTWLLENITSVGVFSTIITSSQTLTGFRFKHNGLQQDLLFGTNSSYEIVSGHKYFASINFKGVDPTTLGGVSADDIMFTDLTQDFGTAIADYVYSLEQATAGTGVAWLKTHFPKQFNSGYQPYDAGTLKSIEGLSAKKTVGFNQWDEVVELGYIGASSGENTPSNINIRSKNYIPVFPNTAYYLRTDFTQTVFCPVFFYDADKNFVSASIQTIWNNAITTPSNACYMRFYMQENYGTTYNHDICINLSDPTKNGTYEPYEAHSYPLDSDVVLRGIPKVNEQGKLYYDGDEYLPDGTVNRRYGVVDLGTLNWAYNATNSQFRAGLPSAPKDYNTSETPNAICSNYIAHSHSELSDKQMSIFFSSVNGVNIMDLAYTDATTFKVAMSGVMLVYELATPTTETADPYQTPQIISHDGTEEYIYTDGAFELPVGHSSDYPVDVSGQLDDILDTPSANGTYVLKATVADGAVSYSWVADA